MSLDGGVVGYKAQVISWQGRLAPEPEQQELQRLLACSLPLLRHRNRSLTSHSSSNRSSDDHNHSCFRNRSCSDNHSPSRSRRSYRKIRARKCG